MAYARFLPEELPPPAQRLIEEYSYQHGDPPILVGGYVRLQILDQLHDAYVLGEDEGHLRMRTKCGVDVRQSREEVGAMRWMVDPDTNPPCLTALQPTWFLLATERPRNEQVGSIDVHLPPPVLKAEGVSVPPSSVHRRVRLFSMQEDRRNPKGAPNFVYVKMFYPYLLLRSLPKQRPSSARPRSAASRVANTLQLQQDMLCGYMREQSAHSILHHCQPQVAPKCFYSHLNEASGSYALVLEDLVNSHIPWTTLKEHKLTKTDKEEAEQWQEHKTSVKRLGKVFEAVGVLHGRFMRDHQGPVPVSKKLLQAMVHPKLFWAMWRDALGDDEELACMLAKIYGIELPPPTNDEDVEEGDGTSNQGATEVGDELTETSNEKQAGAASNSRPNTSASTRSVAFTDQDRTANNNSSRPETRESANTSRGGESASFGARSQRRNMIAYQNNFDVSELAPSSFDASTSLTLLHGRLHEPTHLRAHQDPRGVPNILLVDWKYSGIGPAEVDLLQLMMLVPASTRKKDPDMMYYLLHEYLETVRLFYPEVTRRTLPDLLCRMRTVALICLGTDPFDWNGQGEVVNKYVQLHQELCEKTTKSQLAILQKRIEEQEALYTF